MITGRLKHNIVNQQKRIERNTEFKLVNIEITSWLTE